MSELPCKAQRVLCIGTCTACNYVGREEECPNFNTAESEYMKLKSSSPTLGECIAEIKAYFEEQRLIYKRITSDYAQSTLRAIRNFMEINGLDDNFHQCDIKESMIQKMISYRIANSEYGVGCSQNTIRGLISKVCFLESDILKSRFHEKGKQIIYFGKPFYQVAPRTFKSLTKEENAKLDVYIATTKSRCSNYDTELKQLFLVLLDRTAQRPKDICKLKRSNFTIVNPYEVWVHIEPTKTFYKTGRYLDFQFKSVDSYRIYQHLQKLESDDTPFLIQNVKTHRSLLKECADDIRELGFNNTDKPLYLLRKRRIDYYFYTYGLEAAMWISCDNTSRIILRHYANPNAFNVDRIRQFNGIG